MGMAWDEATGWEFDALRRLPDPVARRLWFRATVAAWRLVLTTRAGLTLAVFVALPPVLLSLAIWLVAWLLGSAEVWRVAAELAAHVLLYHQYHRFVTWAKCEFWFPYMRPFVRVELFRHDPATYGAGCGAAVAGGIGEQGTPNDPLHLTAAGM
jgi:hypothetical protein